MYRLVFYVLIGLLTMYRLVFYVLIGLLGMAAILAYFKLLPFSPLSLLASTLFLVIMCWAWTCIATPFTDCMKR